MAEREHEPIGRRLVYGLAAGVFAVAVALAALRVGEQPGRLSDWQALVLGITQGVTELLPISSSGHLILVPWIGDWHYLETHDSFNKTFDVALHLGTLVAVVAYFWDDVRHYVAAWLRSIAKWRVEGVDERVAWYLALASLPAAPVGAFGESVIERRLGQPWQIAIALALFGVFLWIADRRPGRRHVRELGARTAVLIGVSQILALVPGVSRSGITITAGRFAGLNREAAARFSFLLLIPIVFGAVVYKGTSDVLLNSLPAGSTGPFVVGTLAATAVGLVAIDLLLGYVRRHTYTPFVVYRLIAAAVVALLILSGWRGATF